MKTIALLITGLFFAQLAFSSLPTSYPIKQIEKYTADQQNAVRIPTPFAQKIIITPDAIKLIENQKIHKVELIYTRYSENPSFSQKKLNDQRISELMALVPKLNKDDIEWVFVEQTGAKSTEEAKNYFHGFVLHYGDMTSYRELKSLFAKYQAPFQTYSVNNETGATINSPSGSVLRIPKSAVVNANGTPLLGNYTINYREFRNQSEILFSGIPMRFDANDTTYNFESFGMYEIRGEQNGDELRLQKPIEVDFMCTTAGENVDFYSLNDTTEKWTSLEPIHFLEDTDCKSSEIKDWTWNIRTYHQKHLISFSEENYLSVREALLTDKNWNTEQHQLEFNDPLNGILMDDQNYNALLAFLWNSVNTGDRLAGLTTKTEDQATKQQFQTPVLVRGLKSARFGIFNCDGKTYFKEPYKIESILANADGAEIDCQKTVCVINKNVNGVLSFHPNNVTCDARGRNTILLFTEDERIFMLEDLKLANQKAPVMLQMTEITEEIARSEDLNVKLGLR